MKMIKGDLLAVYGSLRVGMTADLSKKSGVTLVGQGTIDATLYDLGWYPGVKFDPSGVTHVDIFWIADDSVSDLLDAYEGHPTLFTRIESFADFDGSKVPVWVYEYARSITGRPVVTSGDWPAYQIERLNQEENA